MSNGDWHIDPEVGQILSRVVPPHKREAREASGSMEQFCDFLEQYHEDPNVIRKHSRDWRKIREHVESISTEW
jgi:hypothetical protein